MLCSTYNYAKFTTDVNECDRNPWPCPSGGVCHNTEGGYRCSCRKGRKFSKSSNTCIPDIGLIIGIHLTPYHFYVLL